MASNHKNTAEFGLRRRRLLQAGAALAVTAPTMMRSAFAQSSIELKASLFPPPVNGAVKVIDDWGDALGDATDGQVQLALFPSSQMGPPNRQYDLVRDGIADFSWVLHGFTPGRFPLTDIADLPDLFADAADGTAALARAKDYLVPEHKGVKVLGLVASPPLVMMTREKPVSSIADFEGMRVRPPSAVAAGVIQTLGGSSVAVPPAEMSEALAKGVVDAIVTSAEAARSFRLFETVKYITDINMGVATFAFVMNPDSYNRLPDDIKAAVDGISGDGLSTKLGKMFVDSEVAGRQAAKEEGVEFVTPETEAASAFAAAFKDHRETVVAKLAADGAKDAQAVYDALQA